MKSVWTFLYWSTYLRFFIAPVTFIQQALTSDALETDTQKRQFFFKYMKSWKVYFLC